MDIIQIVLSQPNPIQTYALVFMLGSLSVSSLSDLRRLAAQADFTEVWMAYVAAMFLADAIWDILGNLGTMAFILKWSMILLIAAAFRMIKDTSLSTMDQTALMALYSTLNPVYLFVAVPATLVINELLHPLLRRYGHDGAYPFLPTVFAVNLLVILIVITGGIESYIGLVATSSS